MRGWTRALLLFTALSLAPSVAIAVPEPEAWTGVELVYRIGDRPDVRQGVDDVMKILRERFESVGIEKRVTLQKRSERGFAVRLTPENGELAPRVKRIVARRGSLEFRITVEPEADVWEGAFEKFVADRKRGDAIEDASRLEVAELDERDRKDYPHGLRWLPLGKKSAKFAESRTALDHDGQRWVLVEIDRHNVTQADLAEVTAHRDASAVAGRGYAVGFRVVAGAQDRMESLTDLSVKSDRYMAIVIDGRVDSAPHLNSSLRASGLITGEFSEDEAKELAAALRAKAVDAPLQLLSETTRK